MNKTTIEFKEKSIDTNSYLKYDLGVFKNLQEVLGKNVLIWWIPIIEQSDLKGYAYDINQEYNFDYFKGKEESKNFYTSHNSQYSYFTKSDKSNCDFEENE